MNSLYVVPEQSKLMYDKSSEPLTVTIPMQVPISVLSKETVLELADEKHIGKILKARAEYASGDTVDESVIMAKLK